MRCAVLGDPIAHSLSPVLHRAGYAASGLDWSYQAMRVASGGLPDLLASLDEHWRGLSLTMPLKREALGLVDHLSDRAELAGGANTLVRTDGQGWRGDNTDLPGAIAAITERYDAPMTSATIWGAGATAASIGLALVELGVTSIRLLARDPARATETAAVLRAHPGAPQVRVGRLDPGEGADRSDVLVSTIPALAQRPELVAAAARSRVVFEAIYHPWPTPLASAIAPASSGPYGAPGTVLVSGLDLLVHQAALQFEIFTGLPAPLADMRAAGQAALAERGHA